VSDESLRDDDAAGRQRWRAAPQELWHALESKPQDDGLDEWLTTQRGVTIRSHGGFAPELWTGEVDGHSFTFRERHGQWDIKIDHRPSGEFVKQFTGTGPDGTATYGTRELEVGELIASGTIGDASYGTTAIERAQFIIEKIRAHLTRQSCSHCGDQLGAIEVLLGVPARWCPLCGAVLSSR
jgi:hypothetical protein